MLILPVIPDEIDEFLEQNLIDKNSIGNERKDYRIGIENKYYYLDPLTELPINLYRHEIFFCFDTNMFYTKDSFKKLFRDKYKNDEIKLTQDSAARLENNRYEPQNIINIDELLEPSTEVLFNIKFTKENYGDYIDKQLKNYNFLTMVESERIWGKYMRKFYKIKKQRNKLPVRPEPQKPVECMICFDDIEPKDFSTPNIISCVNYHKVHKTCLDLYYSRNNNVGCFLCGLKWDKEYKPPENLIPQPINEEFEDENLEINLEAVGEVQPDNQLQFIHNYNLKGVINTMVFYVLNYMIQDFIETAPFGTMKIKIFLSFIAQMIIVYYIMQNRKELF